jgi:hypothetical protein
MCVSVPAKLLGNKVTDLRNRQEGQTFRRFQVDDRVIFGVGHADAAPTQYGYQCTSR